MSELTHVVEALLFVAAEPLTVEELAEAAAAPPERVERALDALAERHCEGRSGVVLERVAGGYGFRAASGTAEACARLFERAPDRPLSHAALETLAVIAYAGPVSRPEIARVRGVSADGAVAGLLERGLIEEAGRGRHARRAGAVPHDGRLRSGLLARGRPPLAAVAGRAGAGRRAARGAPRPAPRGRLRARLTRTTTSCHHPRGP